MSHFLTIDSDFQEINWVNHDPHSHVLREPFKPILQIFSLTLFGLGGAHCTPPAYICANTRTSVLKNLTFLSYEFGKGQYTFYTVKLSHLKLKKNTRMKMFGTRVRTWCLLKDRRQVPGDIFMASPSPAHRCPGLLWSMCVQPPSHILSTHI